MAHQIPKELKGEERLFVIPWLNLPVSKKSLIYNGPATLIAVILGKISGKESVFIAFLLILNIIAYPLGNTRRRKKVFDNGYMHNDMYLKKLISWKLKGGGNIYISHKFEGGE